MNLCIHSNLSIVLPHRARVDLGMMTMKGHSAFPKAPALQELHHQVVQSYIQYSRLGSLTLLQRSSRCIQQPQPTGQCNFLLKKHWYESMYAQQYLYRSSKLDNVLFCYFLLTIFCLDFQKEIHLEPLNLFLFNLISLCGKRSFKGQLTDRQTTCQPARRRC